jgi:hypothetical protein
VPRTWLIKPSRRWIWTPVRWLQLPRRAVRWGDTTSVQETLPAAGYAVAEQIATATAQGQYPVPEQGMCEVVTDQGYHCGPNWIDMREMGVRS